MGLDKTEFDSSIIQGLVEVLIEDNVKQELSSGYRSNIEDELASKER